MSSSVCWAARRQAGRLRHVRSRLHAYGQRADGRHWKFRREEAADPRIPARFGERGWKDGENIRVIYRWSTGKRDLIDQYVRELVALKPEVILANSTPVISTFKNQTSTRADEVIE